MKIAFEGILLSICSRHVRSLSRASACRRGGEILAFAVLLLFLTAYSGYAQVQVAPLRQGPGAERPELPSFEPPERKPGLVLPPIPIPQQPDTEGLAGGVRVFVSDICVTGSTVLSEEELKNLTVSYKARTITYADLAALRDRITGEYIRRGYVSSGAIIPDQTFEDGVIEIQVVEGGLADVVLESGGRFRPGYLSSRIRRSAPDPVNVYQVEQALQILQQDPRIVSVKVELVPGAERGESILKGTVSEEVPFRIGVQVNNHHNPTVGSTGLRLDWAYTNISGYGDWLSAIIEFTEGLWSLDTSYEIPISPADTKLQLRARVASSEVIEDPFEDLDIESETQQFGFSITHPVYRILNNRHNLFLSGEWRRSKDFLLGSGFQFSEGVSEDGVSKVTVLRLGHDWLYQGRGYALALRNTFSFGIPVLGATDHNDDRPDTNFVTWLGQIQWAGRVPFLGRYARIITRADMQVADDSLLGLEQFAIGGHSTVRGYRENYLVRDSGVIGSVEVRIPLLRKADGTPILEAAPFFDTAKSWNEERSSGSRKTISSVGVGALWQIVPGLRAEGYWGHNLDNVNRETEYDLQDDGFHFMLVANYPF